MGHMGQTLEFTWVRPLNSEALAEGGSMERVIRSPARAIRTMRQPAGLVALFGRSAYVI